jgi:Tfp pilus assembly protein PilF
MRPGLVGTFLVAILLLPSTRLAAQELPPALADRFSEGVSALKSGALDEAETAFREVLRGGGNLAFVHHNLGIVLQSRGRHEAAVAEFRAALRLDPSFAPARLLEGTSLLALGRTAEALAALKAACKAMPQEQGAHLALANAYERADNIAGVTDEYRTLRALAPGNADYAYRLGKAYLRLAQWSFERMRAVDPSTGRLPQALAQQYIDQDRLDPARIALEQAAARGPALDDIHLQLARIYARQGNLDRARAEVARELAIAPSSAAALALKAKLDAAAPR